MVILKSEFPDRAAGRWWRASVLMLGAILLAGSAYGAMTGIARSANPEPAFAIGSQIPNGQRAKLRPSDVADLARAWLSAEAIDPRAARMLGEAAEKAGDGRGAMILMKLGDRLSRRDLRTQMWLVMRDAEVNNIAGVLDHCDSVLRVNADAANALFPILTRALEDSQIQSAFVPYLKAEPPWLDGFLGYAVDQTPHPEILAALLQRLGGLSPTQVHHSQEAALITQLAAKHYYALARSSFLGLPGFDPKMLTSLGFEEANNAAQSGVFGWQIIATSAIGGSFAKKEGQPGARLQIFAGSGENGLVAQKMLSMAPGNYQFHATYSDLHIELGASITWRMRCLAGNNAEIIWQSDAKTATDRARKMIFTVPASCEAEYIDLIVAGGPGQNGAEFDIDAIHLDVLP
jgi:hypothetical protein